jgi:nitrogen fixation NifU-like protein
MSDLRELYQETLLDHYRQPRNFGPLEDANRVAEGFNPLCGDHMKLYLKVEDGIIRDIRFESSGCAISTASGSLMSEFLKGQNEADALQQMNKFQCMVTGVDTHESMGKLEVLSGIREFPERVKCATLAWHTLKAALENKIEPVTTE